MEAGLVFVAVVVAIIILTPALVFRPLIVALADRIAGKKSNAAELRSFKDRLARVELELSELRGALLSIEESHEFSKKLADRSSGEKSPADTGTKDCPVD